jgi:ABC-type multidrug transport system permease subunit
VTPATRSRLSDYAVWQAWDFLRERGLSILLVGGLVGMQVIHLSSGFGTLQETMVAHALMPFVPLFVLLSINRIVSADRTMGYYRLLFSKPVSVSLYYAQRYVITLVGLLLCVALLCGIAVACGVALPVFSILAYVTILYLSLGGVGFLLSVITRFDWTLLLAIWYGSELLFLQFGERRWHAVLNVLPPSRLVEPVRDALLRGDMPSGGALAWLVGYGVACLIAGILLLERRPLSS